MLGTRLPLALDRGLIVLPEAGQIAVFGAGRAEDLLALPKDRVQVIQRHFPDHKALADAGFDTRVAPEGPFALSIICLPRSKAEAQDLIAKASRMTTGPLIIDGAKTDGVDRFVRDLKARADVGEVYAKAHGKIFAVTGGDFADWARPPTMLDGGFTVPHGAFSSGGIDAGSAALAAVLPGKLFGRVVDLGAGWGYLSKTVLGEDKVTSVDLVEADHAALDAARVNLTDRRAHFHWADARTWMTEPVEHVVTNPPFHTGRKGDTGLGQAFIQQAARLLRPSGTLWLVANRHLPYEKTLDAAFGAVNVLEGSGSYKLFAAAKPRQPSRKSRG